MNTRMPKHGLMLDAPLSRKHSPHLAEGAMPKRK